LSISHGVAGIYWVGTLEEYRRRGIAGALTAAALLEGRRRGLRVGTLQASSLGAPVYRGLGFEEISRVRQFRIE
jgi:predicted acetyltransferase